ncbi:MAG: NUDIX hydrolase [Elusimicrobiaceae bacterium]|jgi:8-oxo-dGTP pyrophosphatase MutT (NUDIX family)
MSDFSKLNLPGEAANPDKMSPVEFSCGGIVLKENKICLICVAGFDRTIWTLPKGHLEQGETARKAALREVEEETGCRCRIIRPAGRINYSFRANSITVHKTVQWYLMEFKVKVRNPDPREIADVRWLEFESARKLVRYDSDRRLIDIAEEYYKQVYLP